MSGFDAIVVGSVDVGESSRIVKLLTAESGRIAVMASGARSSKRRYAGLLDPGTRLRVEIRRGRGELPSLSRSDLLVAPRLARQDLDRLALLSYGVELCAALAPEHHEATRLHGLLGAWLDLLEGADLPTAASRIALEAKALTFAGLAPMLLRCARCGGPVEDPLVFGLESGGTLHARCGGGAPVDAFAAKLVELLRRTPLAETPPMPIPQPFRWLLSDFARHQLGRALRSRGLLEDVDRLDGER